MLLFILNYLQSLFKSRKNDRIKLNFTPAGRSRIIPSSNVDQQLKLINLLVVKEILWMIFEMQWGKPFH